MALSSALAALKSMGFTALEAEVYAFLLTESPATGYRVAQGIGKPAANTYKALESLLNKGALTASESGTKLYRPISPETVLDNMDKQFAASRALALESLKAVAPQPKSTKLSILQAWSEAMSAADLVMGSAKSCLVIMCSADVAAELEPTLKQVQAKCQIFWMSPYEPRLSSNDVYIACPLESFEQPTLQVVADKSLAVFASGDEDMQGFLARESSFCASLHQSVVCQIGLYQVDQKLEEDASKKQIMRVIEQLP